MSLALASVKNLCTRKDGCLHVDLSSVSLEKNEKIYIVMAVIVPYSVDSKARKNSQGKTISEHKGAGEKIRTASQQATPTAYFNQSYDFNITDLTTINFLQLECWQVRSVRKDHLLGMFEVPISNSFIASSKTSFPLNEPKNKDKAIGEIELKLKLNPSTPGLEVISLASENLGRVPKFIFDSFWLPRFLKELNLPDCGIEEIPEDITKLSLLLNLNLAQNSIKEIPNFLFSLTSLGSLDLSANKITEIPLSVLDSKIQVLNVIDNPIKELDPQLENCKILRTNYVPPMPITPRTPRE